MKGIITGEFRTNQFYSPLPEFLKANNPPVKQMLEISGYNKTYQKGTLPPCLHLADC